MTDSASWLAAAADLDGPGGRRDTGVARRGDLARVPAPAGGVLEPVGGLAFVDTTTGIAITSLDPAIFNVSAIDSFALI